MAKPAARHYVALLRAVNVGGNSLISMSDLRAVFEACGARNVATHIQSGNVLFESTETDLARLAQRVERRLESAHGVRSKVFILTEADLVEALRQNPFRASRPDLRCNLVFLSDAPLAERAAALAPRQTEGHRFTVRNRVLYVEYVVALRRPVDFERLLAVSGTARTRRVVERLLELCRERVTGGAPTPAKSRTPAAARARAGNARPASGGRARAPKARRPGARTTSSRRRGRPSAS